MYTLSSLVALKALITLSACVLILATVHIWMSRHNDNLVVLAKIAGPCIVFVAVSYGFLIKSLSVPVVELCIAGIFTFSVGMATAATYYAYCSTKEAQ